MSRSSTIAPVCCMTSRNRASSPLAHQRTVVGLLPSIAVDSVGHGSISGTSMTVHLFGCGLRLVNMFNLGCPRRRRPEGVLCPVRSPPNSWRRAPHWAISSLRSVSLSESPVYVPPAGPLVRSEVDTSPVLVPARLSGRLLILSVRALMAAVRARWRWRWRDGGGETGDAQARAKPGDSTRRGGDYIK